MLHSVKSRGPMWPLQIASHPHNNCLVVLVHGVMSTRYAAWSDAIDLIQQISAEGGKTPTFGSYDFRAFGYPSGLIHQPGIRESFPRLRTLIADPKYDSIVLIGHSQGGVLIKLFLIEELQAGRGQELKVDVVITLDSPHRGPKPWIYPFVVAGGLWKRIPFLRRFPLWRQIGELGIGSRNLRTLRRHWTTALVPEDPQPPQPTSRHMRSYSVSGTRLPLLPTKLVVSRRSAEGFDVDRSIPLKNNVALDIGHGVAAMASAQHDIEQILAEHDYENVKQVEQELTAATPAMFSSVLTSRCPAPSLPCEVDCWQRRVADGFPRRPLRRLAMPAVLRKFIELRLGHP